MVVGVVVVVLMVEGVVVVVVHEYGALYKDGDEDAESRLEVIPIY